MEPDPDVLEMVREQLDRESPPSTEALYGRAVRINRDIYELSLRQFNATYVLRVKRERKRDEAGGGSGGGSGGGGAGSGEASAPTEESDEVEPRPGGFLDALREEEDEGGEAGTGDGAQATSEAAAAPPAGGPEREEHGDGGSGLRARVRSILWRYARRVAARPGLAGALAAVEEVDDRVEEILRLARAGALP